MVSKYIHLSIVSWGAAKSLGGAPEKQNEKVENYNFSCRWTITNGGKILYLTVTYTILNLIRSSFIFHVLMFIFHANSKVIESTFSLPAFVLACKNQVISFVQF